MLPQAPDMGWLRRTLGSDTSANCRLATQYAPNVEFSGADGARELPLLPAPRWSVLPKGKAMLAQSAYLQQGIEC
jgi:hypothetical protein